MKIIGNKSKLEELTWTEKIVMAALAVGTYIGVACNVSLIAGYYSNNHKNGIYQETKIEMSLQKALELYNNNHNRK